MTLIQDSHRATAAPLQAKPAKAALAPPRLSIVIVNYHQWENTARLVEQARGAATARQLAEVLIVDNDAQPHPLARKLRRAPGVSLLRWRRNRGFARAVNEGCRLARGEWLLLLNPDVTLPHGFVDEVLQRLEQLAQQPRVGLVGYALRNSDGSRQLSTGRFPTLLKTLLGLAWPRSGRKYQSLDESTRQPVDWATGCCLLVRRACWHDLNGLDEDFFLYYEDVDLCRRAQTLGWSVHYDPSLHATHHHPLHQRHVPAALRVVTRHSLLTYAWKHWPGWQFKALTAVVRLEAWWRQRTAQLCGQHAQADCYRQLGTLARQLAQEEPQQAQRTLEGLTRTTRFCAQRT